MPIKLGRTKASAMLDLVRGLAALLVCLGHWRNLLFVDYGQRAGHGPASAVFYAITSCGHQSVVVFFVLSGYLIGGSVRGSAARGDWSWPGYAIARLTRLWVVLVPGLLLCALWDAIGMRSGWAPRLYSGNSGDHMVLNVALDTTWPAFLRTLFFLQEILGRTFGSDGPLWSLAYEFWYYVLFPLGFFALRPTVPARLRGLCVVLLALVAWFQGREMLGFLPIWLLGVALTYLPRARAGRWQKLATVLAYLPVFLLASRTGRLIGPPHLPTALLSDYLVGLSTTALLWVLLSSASPQTRARWERIGHHLARFSFTLYVVHTPFLVLLAAWAGRDKRWQPDPPHLLYATALLALTLAFAWAVAWATEFRTGKVRHRLESALA